MSGDDAAASAALAARRDRRAERDAAMRKAELSAQLRAKLAQLASALETDIIAAEAAARPPPPPPKARAPPPVSSLNDEELSERFIALESAGAPLAGSLEMQLRRAMRLRAQEGDADGTA